MMHWTDCYNMADNRLDISNPLHYVWNDTRFGEQARNLAYSAIYTSDPGKALAARKLSDKIIDSIRCGNNGIVSLTPALRKILTDDDAAEVYRVVHTLACEHLTALEIAYSEIDGLKQQIDVASEKEALDSLI